MIDKPEYIERGALIAEMDRIFPFSSYNKTPISLRTAVIHNLINQFPAADVEPVVHGEWEWKPPYMVCSACSRHAINRYRSKYCQHCGAKMRNPRGAHMDERSDT